MVNSVMLRANAKINLGLHLVGKRPDGYHLLETLFYPLTQFCDTLWVERVEGNECTIEMEGISEKIALEDNLCYKAWRLVANELEKKETGMRIRIKKAIPAGAGLGGGSSNAAAILKACRSLWQPDLPDAKLAEWGARLGADVPFFIYNRPMYATGIGTTLEPYEISLDGFELRLKTFMAHSSTVQAYREVLPEDIGHVTPLRDLLDRPFDTWRGNVVNDLEKPVCQRLPFICAAVEDFYKLGAVYAAMSGSGSACYGLFLK
jgi:4-diphosphocytidyl-2-C-methyl-D-erythritol kinase